MTMATALSGSCTSFRRRACMPPGDCEPSLGVMSVSANPTYSMACIISAAMQFRDFDAMLTLTDRVELEQLARTMVSSYLCRERYSSLQHPRTLALTALQTSTGDVAQLGERLVCNQEVEGSIPFVSILTPSAVTIYNCRTAFRETRRSPRLGLCKNGGQGRNFSYFNRLRLVGFRPITRRWCKPRIRCTSLWADENRGRLPKTAPWDYVDVSLDEPRYDSKFSGDTSSKGCVVDKINEFRLTVKDTGGTLAWLGFLAPLHRVYAQLYHVGVNVDKGSNHTRVRFIDKGINMHALWDSGMIGRTSGSKESWLAELGHLDTPEALTARSRERSRTGPPKACLPPGRRTKCPKPASA